MSGWARVIGDVISAFELLVTNDDGAVQLMQGKGEQADNASEPEATPQMPSMAYPYGISACPPVGSDVLALGVEGRPEKTVISVQHREHRPKALSLGEVVLHLLSGKILVYLDPSDDTLHLGMKGATDFVPLASLVKAELDDIRSKHDTHIHTTTATIGLGPALGVISPPTSPMGPAGEVASEVVRCV